MNNFFAFLLISFIVCSCQNNEMNSGINSQQTNCDNCYPLYKDELFCCLPKKFVRDNAFDSTFTPYRNDEKFIDNWRYISTDGYKTLNVTDSLGSVKQILDESIDAVTIYKVRNPREVNIAAEINRYFKNLFSCNNRTEVVEKKYSKKGKWNMFEVAYIRPHQNIQLFKYEIFLQQGLTIIELIYSKESYKSDTAEKKFMNDIENIKICSTTQN